MAHRIETHKPPDGEKKTAEILRKRDAKFLKKAVGSQALKSVQIQEVKSAINKQDVRNGIELEKRQLKAAQKALGNLATEKGITKIFQRYRARSLKKQIANAEKDLA